MSVKDWASSFWITLLDEAGETFYANPTTGERKWELPAGSLVLPRSADGQWYELWSDEYGLPYYFHTLTNETAWHKPEGFVIPLKAVQRFSKGKRFSLLSLDSASISLPAAPESIRSDSPSSAGATISDSDSFQDLAKRSLELDESDPLAAALLQCMVANTLQLSQNLNASVSSKKSTSSSDTVFSDAVSEPKSLDHESSVDQSFASSMLLTASNTESSLLINASSAVASVTPTTGHAGPHSPRHSIFQSFGTDGSLASAATLSSPIAGPGPLSRSFSSTTDTIASPSSPLLQQLDRDPLSSPLSQRAAWASHTTQASQGTLGRSELAYAGITFDEVEHSILDEQLQLSPKGILASPDSGQAHVTFGNLASPESSPRPDQDKSRSFARALFNAPLLIKKRKSKIALGEAFEPVLPVEAASVALPPSPRVDTSSPKASPLSSPRLGRFFSKREEGPESPPRILDLVEGEVGPSKTFPLLADLALPDPAFIEEARKRKFSQPAPAPTEPFDVNVGCVSPKQTWSRAFSRRAISAEVANRSPKVAKDAVPSPVTMSPTTASLPTPAQDRQRTAFLHYAEQHFGPRKKGGMFGKHVELEDIVRWQAADLEAPLLNLPKALRWDALQCFTHLQHVMGDRVRSDSTIRISLEDAEAPSPWDDSTITEAYRILALGVESSPLLRDEIFVQLLCQLAENPSAISSYRGWQFMQVLLVTFPPSPELEPSLRRFLLAGKGSLSHSSTFDSLSSKFIAANRSRLAIIAKFCLIKLDQIIVKGPRGKAPSHFEIRAASEGAFQPCVFGESLQRIMSLQSQTYPDVKVPIILPFLADGIVALGGLRMPNIFRSSGDMEKVNELRIYIDQGKYSFSNGFDDPNVAASLLKLWLRELMHPLIPLETHAECLEAAEDEKRVLEIIQGLPSLNRRIIAFLISFLQIFTQEAVVKATNMPAGALAMIFTPALFRQSPPGLTEAIGKGPAISGPSSTTKAISTVFDHARKEQKFLLQLLTYLDVMRMEDEDNWVPSHGKSSSLASSNYSTAYSASVETSMDASATLTVAESHPDTFASLNLGRPILPVSATTSTLEGVKQGLGISTSASSPVFASTSPQRAFTSRPVLDRTASDDSTASTSSDNSVASSESGFSLDARSLGSTRRKHKDRHRTRQPTAPVASMSASTPGRQRPRTRTEGSFAAESDSSRAASSGSGSETTPEIPQKSRMRHISEPSRPVSLKNKWSRSADVPAVPKLVKPRIIVDEAD